MGAPLLSYNDKYLPFFLPTYQKKRQSFFPYYRTNWPILVSCYRTDWQSFPIPLNYKYQDWPFFAYIVYNHQCWPGFVKDTMHKVVDVKSFLRKKANKLNTPHKLECILACELDQKPSFFLNEESAQNYNVAYENA